MNTRIVLTTLNARYSHTSFGLRYLMANLGPWRSRATLLEFTIHQPCLEIVEKLLALNPSIIGFGIYIWNLTAITEVIRIIRQLRPNITLIIGGPEVSFEYHSLEVFQLTDHLIRGEADLAFRALIDGLESGARPPRVLSPPPPPLELIALPYDEYSDIDLRQRLIYVEASRGCPFRCEFCLSSLDVPVRRFPLASFLEALGKLKTRGARAFKFVDRTFNLNLEHSSSILEWCLHHHSPDFELHFEMIPDRLPEAIRGILTRFPAGSVQLEIGLQSFSEYVNANISRRQKLEIIEENFAFLREKTGVHTHADLIVGLPGETLESLEESFNRALELEPGEIQVGFLKRLRGVPIARHVEAHQLIFSSSPPYEILRTGTLSFELLQRLKRFARYFDLYFNHGNFYKSVRMLLEQRPKQAPTSQDAQQSRTPSAHEKNAFQAFLSFSDWLYARSAQTHQFSLMRLNKELFLYLTETLRFPPTEVAEALLEDYDRHVVRRERLEFLRSYVGVVESVGERSRSPIARKRRGKALKS